MNHKSPITNSLVDEQVVSKCDVVVCIENGSARWVLVWFHPRYAVFGLLFRQVLKHTTT